MAEEEIARGGMKPNVSRLSAMTGLYRREVSQIFKKQSAPLYQGVSLIARILARWEGDRKLCGDDGAPRSLTCGHRESEFSKLVASISKDTHEGTILNELRRARLVEVNEGRARLLKREGFVKGRCGPRHYDIK